MTPELRRLRHKGGAEARWAQLMGRCVDCLGTSAFTMAGRPAAAGGPSLGSFSAACQTDWSPSALHPPPSTQPPGTRWPWEGWWKGIRYRSLHKQAGVNIQGPLLWFYGFYRVMRGRDLVFLFGNSSKAGCCNDLDIYICLIGVLVFWKSSFLGITMSFSTVFNTCFPRIKCTFSFTSIMCLRDPTKTTN